MYLLVVSIAIPGVCLPWTAFCHWPRLGVDPSLGMVADNLREDIQPFRLIVQAGGYRKTVAARGAAASEGEVLLRFNSQFI
ncbi:hypothetical protein D3C76_1574870 [compost metagenome]